MTDTTDRPGGDSPVAGFLHHLAGLFKPAAPPAPPPAPPTPMVEASTAAPPYPEPLPASPARVQFERYIVQLTSAAPTATIKALSRPAFWCVYTTVAPASTDGIWAIQGDNPPTAPTLAAGVVQAIQPSYHGAGGAAIYLPGQGESLSLRLNGTTPYTVVVIACTNVPPPRL